MSKLLSELRRRRVLQTFVPYLGFVWLILQIVAVVSPMFNFSPLISTFIAVVLFAGMPVMLYLSWYFDFTIEGLVPIPCAETGKAIQFGALHWFLLTFITLTSGTLAYQFFANIKTEFVKQEQDLQQVLQANSIAVLPFKDSSADQDQAFLGQGLAEEITSLLGQIQELTVAASSSTAILDKKGLDPVAIARRLKVDTVLAGSVRKIGDKLTVRTELINALDGKVLWTESFTRKFKDIFSVENEIARSAVNLLQDSYLESGSLDNPASTNSTDAYVIYLKGREQYRKQTTESMKQARKLFEQAIGLDPEYAQAYVALADTIVLLAEGPERFGVLKKEIAATLAKRHLEKAIVRQPNLAHAYAVLGYVARLNKDPDLAISHLNKAIELNPSLSVAYTWRYRLLSTLNRLSEAIKDAELANNLDPISLVTQYNLAFEYALRNRNNEAKVIYERLIEYHPNSPLGFAGLADLAFGIGNYAKSLEYWMLAAKISPENDNYKNNLINCLYALRMTKQLKELATDDETKISILYLDNNYESLFKEMDFQINASPNDPWLKFEAAIYQMQGGDKNRAIALLFQVDTLLPEEEKFDMPYCSPAIEIAWAFKLSNKTQSFEKLLKTCSEKLTQIQNEAVRQNELNYLSVRIASLNENNDLAIQLLSEAVKNGWREWWTENDPLLSSIKALPEFKKLTSFINTDLTKQRKQALTLFED